MSRVSDPDEDVWRRVFLALASFVLLGVGALSSAGFSPGGLIPERLSAAPLTLGVLGLVAVVTGRLVRVALGGLGVVLTAVGLGLGAPMAWASGGVDSATLGLFAVAGAGAASAWLACTPRRRASGAAQLTFGSTEPWWRSRWWLGLVVTGFPFLFGTAAAAAAIVGNSPDATGCGPAGERLLRNESRALAEQLPGLRLGSLRGCDSGDPASIKWEHDDLARLVASAKASGCVAEADVSDDDPDTVMVCTTRYTQLILEISTGPDPAKLSAHGSISLG